MNGNWNLDASGIRFSQPASEFYGTPFLFQSPRSVQIGVKFTS